MIRPHEWFISECGIRSMQWMIISSNNVILSNSWNKIQTTFFKLKYTPSIFMNEGIGSKLMLSAYNLNNLCSCLVTRCETQLQRHTVTYQYVLTTVTCKHMHYTIRRRFHLGKAFCRLVSNLLSSRLLTI